MFYICRNIFFYLRRNMVSKADLIKIEILLQLQLGLIEEIYDNEKLTENDILTVLEMIKNMSEEISKDAYVLLKQSKENNKTWKLRCYNGNYKRLYIRWFRYVNNSSN